MPATMTAAEAKQALARRHPARVTANGIARPGPWTVIEELFGIDVLAVETHGKRPFVGYEVKVSRSDMRAELLRPTKRAQTMRFCHYAYFAVPKGLLKDEEIAWGEPQWAPQDFQRTPCPAHCYRPRRGRGPRTARLPVPTVRCGDEHADRRSDWVYVESCPLCQDRGYKERSRVEREAPQLWIPRDMGLVEIGARSTRVVRQAPLRTPESMTPSDIAQLTRWVSLRPDSRHEGLVAHQRQVGAQHREQLRRQRAEREQLFAEIARSRMGS